MNTLLAGIAVVLAAALASVVGFTVVSRYVPRRWRVADGDAAGTVYSTIGMVYAILIAIAAIAVWEPRADVATNTEAEASSLIEAYWSANRLAPADRDEVHGLIIGYLQLASGTEWDHLRASHSGTLTAETLSTELRERVDGVRPVTDTEQAAHQMLANQVSSAATARRARIGDADSTMPAPLWPILLGGAVISVGFLYLFGLRRTVPNGLMFAALGGMVALMLFVLYQVELPYSRGFAVDPDSLRAALETLRGADGL
ncbi:bestrophin-like domain [Asanoa siamensis]|uniref:DUF4239 domain-containing protein n=1 Tax=Asanoa siamensis TaxID=926357 RepID=A0ABQ4D234_9ACTN|nr:DUF4239 domain-containing protein [Asanoa siamensis]GIF77599.1 hypothetical protein Asi02nite_71170 [Asanoa siamensis]